MNQIQVLKAKVGPVLNENIRLHHSTEETATESHHKTEVFLASGKLIGEHQSKSQTYARKKAVKNALKYVLELEAQTPAYQRLAEKQALREAEAAKREKAARQKEHLERMEAKKQKRAIIREQKKKEALEREIKRVLNKRNAKNRSAKMTEREKILEQLTDPNINPSKRRFLEDKLK